MKSRPAASTSYFLRLMDTFSIRKKLVTVMMIASCFAMLVTGIVLVLYQTWYFNSRMMENMNSHADLIAYNSTAALAFMDRVDGENTLQSLQTIEPVTSGILYDNQGLIFALWQRDNTRALSTTLPEWRGSRRQDNEILVIRPVIEQGQRLGTLFVRADTNEMTRFMQKSLFVIILLFIATAIITFGLAQYLQTVISRPINSLARTLTRISKTQDYSLRSTQLTEDELGRLSGFLNEMLDKVEERDDRLRENRELLQAIIDNAGAIIYLKDIEGKYQLVNRRYREVVATRGDEIIGRTDTELFSPELAKQFTRLDNKVLESGDLVEEEEIAPHADGDHVYLSAKFPLRDAEGEIYAICGISTDITERKQAEDELVQLQNYLDNVIDSMPSAIIGLDKEGNITRWNHEAERISGLSPAEATGCPLDAVLPEFSAQLEKVHQAIRERRVQSSERMSYAHDGLNLFKEVTVYPLVANGIEGAVLRVDDVTERVQIEEMMIQTEKMLSVGGLAAGMAHEINNPLGIMVQAVQNIERRVSPDLPANSRVAEECGTTVEVIQAYLEKRMVLALIADIREAGTRAAKIVANMLQFSRHSESARQYANVAELIDQTIELAANDYDLKKKYDFRHIEIRRDYAPGLPEVKLVATEFEQVILNLLKNGAQAMAEQPDTDKKPVIRVRLSADSTTFRVAIEDNGPGMERAVRKRVFEPFFTTKPVGSGTGLGLSVSYMIITNNHKGTMDVESVVGKGTTFTISLPLVS